jgi:site-specific DNA-methyltransferase (adenine-specific)
LAVSIIFPEQLAADHILSWSNEGDFVLDPMCGSGTTCKMAAKLNRKYIGFDISQEYCSIAEKRIQDLAM